jgi:methylmalonyl-CoA/ethylmalonyl-CoA epimerase
MSLPEQIFGPAPKPLHLGISVSNLEESIKWYSETLGFTLAKRADLSAHLRIAIVEYQGFGIELIEVRGSDTNPLAWRDPGAQHLRQGVVHFAFEVADLQATADTLRERGAQFACEPTTLKELGIQYFHIFDRDGNLLEFGQRL